MPTVRIDEQRCKGCVLCACVCPHGLLHQDKVINDQGYQFVVLDDPEGKCTGCTLCAVVCPDICIEVYK